MTAPHQFSGPLFSPWLALLGRGWCGLVLGAGLAHGAGYESWSKVEQAEETSEYGLRLREGKFEAEQKAFVERTLLPQLALEANRAAIATVRQRIRDIAVRGVPNVDKPEVSEQVNRINATILPGMLEVVADQAADPVVRVNAMLLVGELQRLNRTPWPGSLEPLAKAAGDGSLPLAVRVAAVHGLARHVAAAGADGPATTAAAPVVAALVSAPPKGDPVAVRWLVSRALELLPSVPSQPAAVTAAARILADDKADTDLRVRAALAVGKLATPQTGIDAAAAIGQIRSLAISALAADLDAAAARRLDRKLSAAGGLAAGGGLGGAVATPGPRAGRPEASGGLFGGPIGGELDGGDGPPEVVDEDAVPPLACRRNAWRLSRLAEAVQPARGGPGLAGMLQGEPAAAAAELATTMRQAAVDLDADPDEELLAAALAALRKLAGPAAPPAGGAGQADGPATPASPFDQPASNSPF